MKRVDDPFTDKAKTCTVKFKVQHLFHFYPYNKSGVCLVECYVMDRVNGIILNSAKIETATFQLLYLVQCYLKIMRNLFTETL